MYKVEGRFVSGRTWRLIYQGTNAEDAASYFQVLATHSAIGAARLMLNGEMVGYSSVEAYMAIDQARGVVC